MRLISALIVSVGVLVAQIAAAYPDKPVKILVGFTPGGTADTSARLVAEKLQGKLLQQFIVENKTGAGGAIAAQALMSSQPNGYTLMLGTGGMLTMLPAIRKDLPYDTLRDFTLVGSLISSSFFLVVRKDLPVNNVRELIEYAKNKQVKLSFTSPGVGTQNHLGMESFGLVTGMKLEHIPFRGDPEAMAAIMGEQVDMGFVSFPAAIAQIVSGGARALAITTNERHERAPNVPTIRESGIDFDLLSWVGIVGPRDLPADIVSRLNQSINGSLRDEQLQKRFSDMGFVAMPNSPDSFRKNIQSEIARWRAVAEQAKISIE